MPELADVETFRRRLARSSLHQRVQRVRVLDEYVVRGTSARTLDRRLRGVRMERTHRRGKQLLVELSDGRGLVLHFGMTGYVAPLGEGDEPPGHTRVLFELADSRLAFVDQRKLGFVALVEDLDEHVDAEGLGPDALDLSRADLRDLARRSRSTVKALLMDQATIAGVGNIYSDEILFHARLDPRRKARDLADNEVTRLHNQLRRVLTTAIDDQADPERMPKGWLLHRREEGASCPRCGGEVRRFSASGRHAYLCPSCQH